MSKRMICNWLETASKDNVKNTSVLICCSGGSDSLALLYFLANAKKILNLKLGCIYVDHRDDQATDESAIVEYHCSKLNITFHYNVVSEKIVPPIETNARKKRWEQIEKVKELYSYEYCATGHNLYDFFETLLIQLNRTDSKKALLGFNRIRGNRWSPLLHLSKEEIETYLVNIGITDWYVDSSNLDESFTLRNSLRKELKNIRKLVPNFELNLLKALSTLNDLL